MFRTAHTHIARTRKLDIDRGVEATPIVVDGVMYTTGGNIVYAFDARNGKPLWKYDPKVNAEALGQGCCAIINRGVAESVPGRLRRAVDRPERHQLQAGQRLLRGQPRTERGQVQKHALFNAIPSGARLNCGTPAFNKVLKPEDMDLIHQYVNKRSHDLNAELKQAPGH